MYTIIGGDGKEYGPVTTDQVRTWIAAGRANLETRAKALGTEEWKTLGDFPAFNPAEVRSAPAFSDDPPVSGGNFSALPGHALAPVGRLEMTVCYERAWELLKANFWPMLGVTILVLILGAGASAAVRAVTGTADLTSEEMLASPQLVWKYFGVFLTDYLFVSCPLGVGFYYYLLKRARGQAASVTDLFAGFSRVYLSLVAASFLVTLLTTLGCFFFLIPGLYFGVAYSLTPILIVDRKLGFWEAMELSRRTVTSQWWTMLAVLLVGILLLFAGLMALLVGVLVAIPFVNCARVYAYLELFPSTAATAPPDQV